MVYTLLLTNQIKQICIGNDNFDTILGHFLRHHISKTTMHDGKFETYLDRKKKKKKKKPSGNYLDNNFTDTPFCNENLHDL